MKKLITFSTIVYLLFAINSSAISQSSDKKILKIGVLLPLSGKFQNIGESFLKSIQLALYEIENKNIKIFPKDSKANGFDSYTAAKEFEKNGIKIVLGPIFFESLERLNEVNKVTFISFTNQTHKTSKNIIAFGININSQVEVLKKYFSKIKSSKTLLLAPKSNFENQVKDIKNSEIKFYKIFFYNNNPNKLTAEIEKLTNYRERKKDLERRINILKKSDLDKDKNELKKLELMHTLGKVKFDSVLILDFDESLKSVLTSFEFVDVSKNNVDFYTVNQWFDETLFQESALQNLHFPSINLKNFKKFKKKYKKVYGQNPNKVSILAYDALGLIYYCWINNNNNFKTDYLYNKDGFKGLNGQFTIQNNGTSHQLKIYKISNNKFIEGY